MKVVGNRNESVPSAFNSFEIELIIDKSIDKTLLDKTVGLVIEKYCSVAASLKDDIRIDFKIVQQ